MAEFATDAEFFAARGPHFLGLYGFDNFGMIAGVHSDFTWSKYDAADLVSVLPYLLHHELRRGPPGILLRMLLSNPWRHKRMQCEERIRRWDSPVLQGGEKRET